MNTIVSLIAVAVVPFGGVQAGYSGPGCPDAGEAAIEENTFCNSFSLSNPGQPKFCPGPTVGFGFKCDRSGADNSGGTWALVPLPETVAGLTESTSLRGGAMNHEQEDKTTDRQVLLASASMGKKKSNDDELSNNTEYERICSAISFPGLCDGASSFRLIERTDIECTQQDEYAVGEWTADPVCCNIGPDECARLGVPSTCDFDARDVQYWHCLFCCEL